METTDSAHAEKLTHLLRDFFAQHVEPNRSAYALEIDENRRRGDAFVASRVVERLKVLAREAGLWNLFLPQTDRAPHARAEFAEHHVAGEVAVGVVDELEVVDIENGQRERTLVAL